MANINAPKIEYFQSYAEEIKSKFQRIKNLVSHNVSSGDYHEEILRNILRNFLTKRYSIKKGFIYATPESVSKQIDIMIIDENTPAAYLFQEGDFAVVMPDAVLGMIEVKTTLNNQEFKTAIENISSAKNLYKYPMHFLGILFGYQGSPASDDTLNQWFKNQEPSSYQSNIYHCPEAILFFTDGCLLIRPKPSEKYYHKLFKDLENTKDLGWQLSVLLAMILNACEKRDVFKERLFRELTSPNLVQTQNASYSDIRFAFGEGSYPPT